MSEQLVAPVWRMAGLTVTPALLTYSEDRVALISDDGTLFDVPVADVQPVTWPKLQFGFGFEATVNGQKYKLTFMRPNRAPELGMTALESAAGLLQMVGGVQAVMTLAKWGQSKDAAKKFRAVLGG